MSEISGDDVTLSKFRSMGSLGVERRQGNPKTRRVGRRFSLTPWGFLAAALVLMITFTYYPVANMFWYSFTSWDGLNPTKSYVGLSNYVDLFTRPQYFQVFFVSLYYIVGSFIQQALALYFATLLSFKTKFKNIFKGIIFFPYLLNGVAVALIFLFFFQPGGTLDSTLHLFGIGKAGSYPLWLGDRSLVNISLSGASIWRYTGLSFVLFLGTIQSIPAEIYEAADIDGANSWQKFRFMILPGIRRILGLSLILAISGAISAFELPYIITGGQNGSSTFVVTSVQQAFLFQRIGFASAMAVVLLVVIIVVTLFQRWVFPDDEVELS